MKLSKYSIAATELLLVISRHSALRQTTQDTFATLKESRKTEPDAGDTIAE